MSRCQHRALMECSRCRQARTRREQAEREATHRQWYSRTGCCGGCGQPGNWCQCGDANPCGCRDLHAMGSGVGVDAVEVFAAGEPPAVSDDQTELFDLPETGE